MNILNEKRKLLPMGQYRGGDSGGGGGSATQTQISDIPEWARPYAQETLAKGSALSQTPYQPYDRQRQADFDPLQNQSFQGIAGLQTPYQTAAGSEAAMRATQNALNTQYNPGQFFNQYQGPQQYQGGYFNTQQVNAPQLQDYQMQGPANVQGQQATAAQAEAAQFQNPDALQAQQVAAERVNAPQLQSLSMQAARDVGTQSFTQPDTASQYMNPYTQNVVNVQQREAQRNADIARTQTNAQAVKAGAFGGSRQAIMDAEAARNLAIQKGDIQARGSQEAFTQGQGQFNAEQQARLQANLANQGVQQQANLQNLSAGLQTQGLGAQTGLQAQGMNQSTGLQAMLANQQTGLQAGQANQNMQYNTGLQNAQMRQQAGLANQALGGQFGLQNAQLAQQAMLANQNMGYNVGNANLQAQMARQQLGSGQNMQAQLANQQYGLNAQQMAEQSRQYGYGQQMSNAQNQAQYGQAAAQLAEQARQYGAGLGLQGAQTALTGAGQLGALGQNQYNQQTGIYGLQNQYGTQRQQQEQNRLQQQYQDFQNQQRYPYQQLDYMSSLIRGTPMGTINSLYQAPVSPISQLAGLGTAAYGASRLMADGGQVQDVPYREGPAGLADLAIAKMV